MYPACSAYGLHNVVICKLSDCIIFFHIFLKIDTIFGGKKVIKHKICVMIFFKLLTEKLSQSKKNLEKYDQNVDWYSCKVPVILVGF
jgi:hypothetical protein